MPKPDHLNRTEMLELQKRLFVHQNKINDRLQAITEDEHKLHAEKANLVQELKSLRPNNLTWLRKFFAN